MTIRSLLAGGLAVASVTGCSSERATSPAPGPAAGTGTRVTSKDGTQIAFDTAGQGPALVIVSGALSSRAMLRGEPLVPMLASHYTVYTYDRRGRGESTDTQPYAVEREIQDLDALIAHIGRPVLVYGVSSGAALSMRAAAKLGPDKIAKLALYEPPFGQEPAEYARQKQTVLDRIGKPGAAAEAFLTGIGMPQPALEQMKRSPQWDAIAKLDHTLRYDYEILGDGRIPEDVTRAIAMPALVMTGEESLPFMAPTADAIAKQLKQGQRKTLPGQTHQAEAKVVVPALVSFFTPSPS